MQGIDSSSIATVEISHIAAESALPTTTTGWPPLCTLAELARILTLVHGVRAPTESSLKKWSAAGAFRACIATSEQIEALEAPSSQALGTWARPRRAGRPGLRLHTGLAIARVYELWPFLAESDPQAVVELVVARTADHLRSALFHAAPSQPTEAHAEAAPAHAHPEESSAALRELEQKCKNQES